MTDSKFETKTTVFDRDHAEYTLVSYIEKETGKISHHELSIKVKSSDRLLGVTWMVVDQGSDIVDIILNTETKLDLIKTLDEFTQEMEEYSYISAPGTHGISTDDYEDVADRIMEKLFLKRG